MEDRHFFIVSPRDIVVGKPRDTDDRIDWLLQHDRFAEVLLLLTVSLMAIGPELGIWRGE